MNIKKLFALLAGVSLVAQTVVPSAGVFGATYSQELQDAYDWAYSKGVTTMSSIDNANMYGAITRAQMAKMLSVYATEVLGATPDTAAACNFTDIDSVKGDLHDYIIQSCQLGLMGQGITAFRPYSTITRAEFGTALSRTLWGDKYNGGTPYYAKHLDALKAAGIMTQIDNPEGRDEVRGYVMIMLQRSAEGGAGVDCDDPVVALACLDPELDAYKECPAACREDASKEDSKEDEVVKSGSLAVSASAAAGRKVIVPSSISDLDTLTFKTSEEVELTKVVLERYGYSVGTDVANVWLEDENGNVISNKASLNTKGQANLTIKKDYRKIDGTYSATIVVETSGTATAGKTMGFKVVDVNSTAKDVDLGDYSPYTYDTVVYGGAEVTFTVRGTSKDYNLEAGESYEVAKFKVKAPSDSAILVKGFTLTNIAGTKIDINKDTDYTDDHEYDYSALKQLDVKKYLDKATVKVGGKEVKASAEINKDDELVVSFDKDVEIAAKENVEITVEATFSEDFDAYGYSVIYGIVQSSHFNAIDAKTEARVAMPAADAPASADQVIAGYSWPTYTFKGGKVKLTNVKLGNVDAAIDSTDVAIAEGSINVTETIKGNITVTVNHTTPALKAAITAMRLEVAGDEYEGKEATPGNGTWTFSNVEIEDAGKVRLLVDITDKTTLGGNDVEGTTFTFTVAGWDTFYYTEGKVTDTVDIAGSISPSKLTIQAAKASLTNTVSKTVEYKNNESNRKVVFDGVYTAKNGAVKINEFALSTATNLATALKQAAAAGTEGHDNKVTFYLLIDGDEVADATLIAGTKDLKGNAVAYIASTTFSNVEIEAGKTANIVVEAEVDAKNVKGTAGGDPEFSSLNFGKFKLELQGEDSNSNKAGYADKSTAELKIVEAGTASVSAKEAVSKTVLRAASNAKIAEFVIKPANGASEVDIDSITFDVKVNGGAPLTSDKVSVTIDNVSEDSVGNTTRYEPSNVTAKSEGVVVKVEIEDETYGVITLDNLEVNGKPASSTFKNRYEEAVVRVSSLKDLGGTTEFAVDVDADSDITVKNLQVAFDIDTASAADHTLAPVKAGGFDDGDTFEAKGAQNNVRLIETIAYDVYGSTNITALNCSTANGCTWHAAVTDQAAVITVTFGDTHEAVTAGDITVDGQTWTATALAVNTTGTVTLTQKTAGDYTFDKSKFTAANAIVATAATNAVETTAGRSADAAHYTLTIEKNDFSDFFKVGSNGYARAYQANK